MKKNIQFVILSGSEGSGCFLITILLQRTPLEGLIQRSYCEEGERWFTPLHFKGRGIEYMDYANRGDRFVILMIDSRACPEPAEGKKVCLIYQRRFTAPRHAGWAGI